MQLLSINTKITYLDYCIQCITYTAVYEYSHDYNKEWILNDLNRITEQEDFTEHNTQFIESPEGLSITAIRTQNKLDRARIIPWATKKILTSYDQNILEYNDSACIEILEKIEKADQGIIIDRDNQEVTLCEIDPDLESIEIKCGDHILYIYID